MEISSTETVPGREVSESLGVVRGNTVRSRNVGSDFAQGLNNIVGGELKGYTKLLGDSRDEAVERMLAEAEELEADAVVNLRFETGSVAQNSVEMLAYGTAVRLE
jgi:uncharacterized protein YbjQ (UPF0145 family)